MKKIVVVMIIPIILFFYLFYQNYSSHNDNLSEISDGWELYWGQLLEPADFQNQNVGDADAIIDLPVLLDQEKIGDKRLTSNGYATIRKTVSVENEGVLGLKNNYLATASKVWVNGELVSTLGKVGTSKEDYTPVNIPTEAYFISESDDLEIVVQTSSFGRRRYRIQLFLLGPAENIRAITQLNIIKDTFLFSGMMVMAAYHLLIYLMKKHNKAWLYLSIISFLSAIRLGAMQEKIIVRVFPFFSAEIISKFGLLPTFLLLPLFIIFLAELIPEVSPSLTKISKYTAIAFTALVLTTSLPVYGFVFNYYKYLLMLGIAYMVLIQVDLAIKYKRRESYIMLIGGSPIFFTAANDLLSDAGYINTPEMFSTGFFLFLLSWAYLLAWQFSESFINAEKLATENEKMYYQIKEMNKNLELTVDERTKELREVNSILKKVSRLDPLTSIPNRRYFNEVIDAEWQRAYRNNLPISIIIADIDYFKQYNDNYGHLAGDECIKSVAKKMVECMNRTADFVARFGGEEFVVLLPETDFLGVKRVAENIRESIEQLNIPHKFSSTSSSLTVSLGTCSTVPAKSTTIDDFIKAADDALYVAKNNGRNTIHQSKL